MKTKDVLVYEQSNENNVVNVAFFTA